VNAGIARERRERFVPAFTFVYNRAESSWNERSQKGSVRNDRSRAIPAF
jgi:hypothetical protein